MSTALALLLAWRKERALADTLIITLPGGTIMNAIVKDIIDHSRASFPDTLLPLTTYSFTTGHAAAGTLFYRFIAAYVSTQCYLSRRATRSR